MDKLTGCNSVQVAEQLIEMVEYGESKGCDSVQYEDVKKKLLVVK